MVKLERLRADHAEALLAFELENRAYFARSIPDRGDAYFAEFDALHQARLAEQDDGICHFHLVTDGEGTILGRVNLIDVEDGSAELGYRVGEQAAGRGVATAAVAEVCRVAGTAYGLTSLVAVTTLDNPASRAVLERNSFTFVEDIAVAGRPGVRYRRAHLGQPGTAGSKV
ncbi:GCN5 family acetyltransferase [Streptomyces viridochromogenes]|uniref:GCN5 family acetyltransferase n=1 Tax=Streptomyces viridochromogenes TaxID=1938 RepID=A0A0J7ZB11_STRVR|nr:GNAT family N-acetyltransferase [Streptomyces viridochromogenes]KMS72622.1 GCN5 family acetyltransferase [Streptomyces viridochromogenes]KOG19633.1 GCN5 family acetyltransferase [Streptomyces viridochromogenes]KOG23093.1 GCN5 family acetyltransferase [Streptomyces viridochromogenes]